MSRSAYTPAILTMAGVFVFGCIKPSRERVDAFADRGEPTCAAPASAEIRARGHLVSGPEMRERGIDERFTLTREGCVLRFEGSLDWAGSRTETRIDFDPETLAPLRATKVLTGEVGQGGSLSETRRFELRGERVAVRDERADGSSQNWLLRAPLPVRPMAVIGTGRGVLTLWLQRAKLAVGGRVRELVLDMRENMEVVREVSLHREADRDDPRLGHVRVYTIYGREPFFADENDVVVGDLMGLVSSN
jgi:hypothetical protein